jgi:hypothetical protein
MYIYTSLLPYIHYISELQTSQYVLSYKKERRREKCRSALLTRYNSDYIGLNKTAARSQLSQPKNCMMEMVAPIPVRMPIIKPTILIERLLIFVNFLNNITKEDG